MKKHLSIEYDTWHGVVSILDMQGKKYLGSDSLEIVDVGVSLSDLLANVSDSVIMFELLFNNMIDSDYYIIQNMYDTIHKTGNIKYYLVRKTYTSDVLKNIEYEALLKGGETDEN